MKIGVTTLWACIACALWSNASLAKVDTHAKADVRHDRNAHYDRMWRIALDSDVLFHYSTHDYDSPSLPQLKAARHRFAAMPRQQLRHALHATLRELPNGTSAQQAVAYVAAMNGFDVVHHASLLDTDVALGQKVLGHRDFVSVAEGIYDKVYDIYRRYPDTRILDQLLRCPSDGAGTECVSVIRRHLLRDQPVITLRRVAASPLALRQMQRALRDGGGREQRALQGALHSRQRSVRRAALLCLRTLSDHRLK